MNHEIYSIYDEKAAAYLQPFMMQTTAAAIRAITDCVTDPEHTFAKHAEDYTLYHLGSFNDENGHYKTETKLPIMTLLEIKASITVFPKNGFTEDEMIQMTREIPINGTQPPEA